MVSNKHFLGVINLYAKVTLGIGVAASIPATHCAGQGVGHGQQLEQPGAGSCQAAARPPALSTGSFALPSPLHAFFPCLALICLPPSFIHLKDRPRMPAY